MGVVSPSRCFLEGGWCATALAPAAVDTNYRAPTERVWARLLRMTISSQHQHHPPPPTYNKFAIASSHSASSFLGSTRQLYEHLLYITALTISTFAPCRKSSCIDLPNPSPSRYLSNAHRPIFRATLLATSLSRPPR